MTRRYVNDDVWLLFWVKESYPDFYDHCSLIAEHEWETNGVWVHDDNKYTTQILLVYAKLTKYEPIPKLIMENTKKTRTYSKFVNNLARHMMHNSIDIMLFYEL